MPSPDTTLAVDSVFAPGTDANIPLSSGDILVGSAGNVATAVTMSGDATIIASGALTIANSAITNAKVAAAAAIDFSKLAALASANILVGSAGNVATSVAVTGDVLISNAGVTSISAIDLATATLTGIADTEILIGTGAGTGAFAALSQDATMANTGAVTVLQASTTWLTPSTTTSAGPGAVAITGSIHEVTTTGVGDALTLADGAEGQHLYVVYVAEAGGADTAICTPTNLAGGTTVTFNAVGDSAHLLFTAGTWFFLGGAAVVA